MNKVTKERGKTHGNFSDNAEISQGIKRYMHNSINWETMSDEEKEALDMIALKISRICSGRPHYRDNWVDVAGYASLIEDILL